MKEILVRVGIDATAGGVEFSGRSPVQEFVFVPIREYEPVRYGNEVR